MTTSLWRKNRILFRYGRKRLCLLLLALTARSVDVSAQTAGGTTRIGRPTVESGSTTTVQGILGFEATQYSTEIPENPKLSKSQLMQMDLDINSVGSWGRARADFSTGKYLDIQNSFFILRELYVSRSFLGGVTSFSLGRKTEFWSEADSNWQLGVWEPKANLDGLRPVGQGLTGLFAKVESGDFEILGFGSPIFVPTMNPEITEKNGSLISDSRWYKTPASSGDVLDRDTNLVYSLKLPDLARLVMNSGAALRARYRAGQQGFWGSVAASRKPVNALQIKYDYNLALRATGSRAEIEVVPVVAYETLLGADLGWNFETSEISMSVISSRPESSLPINERNDLGEPTTDWIQQNPGGLDVATLHGKTAITLPGFFEPVELQADYLKTLSSETRDLDESGAERGALFPHRLNYTHAAQIKGLVSTFIRGRQLISQLKYLREFDQKGSVWSYSAQFYSAKAWVLTAGLDFLGVDESGSENKDSRFLNQFRANDRVYGGVSYVF